MVSKTNMFIVEIHAEGSCANVPFFFLYTQRKISRDVSSENLQYLENHLTVLKIVRDHGFQ